MLSQNYSYRPAFLLRQEISDLKANCKLQADKWECTYRARTPITPYKGGKFATLRLNKQLNARRWYK